MAQNFQPASLVTLSHDTLSGVIAFHNEIRDYNKIHFRNTQIDRFYEAKDVEAFILKEGLVLKSCTLKSRDAQKKIFAECLVSGQKSVYRYKDKRGVKYAVGITKNEIREIPYRERNKIEKDVTYSITPTAHIGFLKLYFQDCPDVFPEIEEMKQPTEYNLIQLMNHYYEKVGKTEHIELKKRRYDLRFGVEPTGTYLISNHRVDVKQPMMGINLYIWLPWGSERLYLKTGVHKIESCRWNNDDIKEKNPYESAYVVPLYFEYVVEGKWIQPKFSSGVTYMINRDSWGHPFWNLGFGANIRLSKNILLDLSLTSDIYDFTFRPEWCWMSYAQAGIIYRFNLKK
ncbi:hypothetical protein K5X82_03300 [Halosquirtibacter xylanolyticus]|uniref:hypothetical protein n=1 Tax=Halosquirtibacter xylanolyticus TaxID=3374599 RepID=UPI00374A5F19|nr:hypothetical protein K5X82_03300 [Prolixibacteraceae bacterium]